MKRYTLECMLACYLKRVEEPFKIFAYEISNFANSKEIAELKEVRDKLKDAYKTITFMPYEELENACDYFVSAWSKVKSIGLECNKRRFKEDEPECRE